MWWLKKGEMNVSDGIASEPGRELEDELHDHRTSSGHRFHHRPPGPAGKRGEVPGVLYDNQR